MTGRGPGTIKTTIELLLCTYLPIVEVISHFISIGALVDSRGLWIVWMVHVEHNSRETGEAILVAVNECKEHNLAMRLDGWFYEVTSVCKPFSCG